MSSLIIYTDGGSRGNPGPSAIGGVIYNQTQTTLVHQFSQFIGSTTNNQAEYKALVFALSWLKKRPDTSLTCYLDSELVVKQVQGLYRVKNVGLQPLYFEVKKLVNNFKEVHFVAVPRSKNKEADALVNQALDQALSS